MPIFAKIATANFEKIGVKLFWDGFFWTINSSITFADRATLLWHFVKVGRV